MLQGYGGAMSSAAVLEPIVEQPQPVELVVAEVREDETELRVLDHHPMAMIAIAFVITFTVTSVMIGSILMWIGMRHSGMLPFESFGR
jgi:hypothetical protein